MVPAYATDDGRARTEARPASRPMPRAATKSSAIASVRQGLVSGLGAAGFSIGEVVRGADTTIGAVGVSWAGNVARGGFSASDIASATASASAWRSIDP